MRRKVSIVTLVAALALLATLLAGCGSRNRDAEPAAPVGIRTPQPTFTPTPVGSGPSSEAPVATIAPVLAAGAEVSALAAEQAVASAPTETPVPLQPGFGGPVTPPATPAAPPPLGIINTELVNSRSGPDTTFPVVVVLGRGEEYGVTGKSADSTWWRLCCVESKDVWAKAEFVDVAESTASVPVAVAGEVSAAALASLNPQTATVPSTDAAAPAEAAAVVAEGAAEAEPTAAPIVEQPAPPAAEAAVAVVDAAPAAEAVAAASEVVAAASAAAGDGSHTLVASERFPETNVVRVFLYVYSGSEALAGYTLRVTKDGVEQTVNGASFGGMAGLTWPIADDRQRFQNFKAEFPGVSPAGTWSVELVKDGAVVGPAATFSLGAEDPNRELYVRYERR